jgi:hypothetical protein
MTKEVNDMEKRDKLFSEPLLEYLKSVNNSGNASTGIPNYSAEKLEGAMKEAKKRAEKCVQELGFDFQDEEKIRTPDDDMPEWEDGEVIRRDAIKLDEDLIKSETREAIKKHLERLMALFLASSIALSAGTVGLIYLKHKDDPKPWQVEKTGETAGTSTNAQPAVIITPTPAKNPIIPTSGEEITQYNQDLTDEDSIDERED